MRSFVFVGVCSCCLSFGCSLETEGQGLTGPSGSGGGTGAAAGSGGMGGTSAAGTGGTAGVDASWPGDAAPEAAAGAGGTQPGDATADAPLDVVSDAPAEVAPEAGVETECLNGLDDDDDGLFDCEDPDCAPVTTCVVAAPGWFGPIHVRVRSSSEPNSDCGSLSPGKSYFTGLVAGGHTCSCICANPSGGTCGSPSAVAYGVANCVGAAKTFAGEGCFVSSVSTNDDVGSVFTSIVPVLTQPTCTSYVSANVGDVTWAQTADTCEFESSSNGCAVGKVCIPRPSTGFTQAACVFHQGDQTCPAGYAVKSTYFEGYDDTRDCTTGSCGCLPVTDAQCTGRLRVHSSPDCSAASTNGSWELDGSCHAVNLDPQDVAAIELDVTGVKGGTCNAMGNGIPTGTATPTGTVTVCCTNTLP